MLKKYSISLFLFTLLLFSCAKFVEKIDSNTAPVKSSNEKLHLVFSHNISGETHPCGCRQFPLGGLPQVYGLFQSLKETGEIIYIDSGDTFFPSSNIPKSMTDSLSYAANNLALGLELCGLNYFVPGDQDFALGIEFLINIQKARKFKFLISNLKNENSIAHENYAVIERKNAKLFIVAVVNPDAIFTKERDLFLDINSTMPKILKQLTDVGYDQSNPHHRLILVSHSGIDFDEKLAELYPQIDWIIGSHSQSFLRFSKDVGNVKIVQTLSKNHYVGDINIDLLGKKDADSYTLHEIRDELSQKANPNPMIEFINNHKARMNEIQLKEQALMTAPIVKTNNKKYKNPRSCLECHKPQVEFWNQTPHSIAYLSLMKSNEENNLACIKCHSLGLSDPKGFQNTKNIIHFKDQPIIDYWNKVSDLGSNVKSVRKLSAEELKVISKKWMDLDKKSNIVHNFSNVQCLNCHNNADDHPFEINNWPSNEARANSIKEQCLKCHTKDQSPEWYGQVPHVLNEKVFQKHYKSMSCPKNESN